MCQSDNGHFETLADKFKQEYDETILSLRYCKLKRKFDGTAEEWRGHLGVKATECNYCKGTGWEVVHDVRHCTSGSPSSSGAVNTKAVASVQISILLTSVIKWSLASDVASCLAHIA